MAAKTNERTGATVTHKTKATGMTKSAAIQQALVDLGKDAKPLQLQTYIKDKFAIEISTNHISASKTDIIRKMTGAASPAPVKTAAQKSAAPLAAKKRVGQKPAAPKPQIKPTPAAASNGKAAGSVALADIATVKALVARVGVTTLKTLIDMLAK